MNQYSLWDRPPKKWTKLDAGAKLSPDELEELKKEIQKEQAKAQEELKGYLAPERHDLNHRRVC